jgi:hypothetical protein
MRWSCPFPCARGEGLGVAAFYELGFNRFAPLFAPTELKVTHVLLLKR